MTDKEKKSKIADILMDFQEEYSNEVINRPLVEYESKEGGARVAEL